MARMHFRTGTLYTINKEPITTELLEKHGIDSSNYSTIDFHCHTGVSPCAENQMTLESIAKEANHKGLHTVCITDHNSSEGLSMEEVVSGVKLVAGIEVKTQYDEFNVVGLQGADEGNRILDSPRFEGKIDMNCALDLIDSINNQENHQNDNRLVKLFNHPFSSLPIPTIIPKLIGYNPRSGFDFEKYIIDNIPEEAFDAVLNQNSRLFGLYTDFYAMYQDAPHAFTSKSSGFDTQDRDYIARVFTHHIKPAQKIIAQELEVDRFVDEILLSDSEPRFNARYGMQETIVKTMLDRFDAVEINCANTSTEDGQKARRLAERYSRPIIAGGDSHEVRMIGEKCINIYPSDMPYSQALDEGIMIPAFTETFHNPIANYRTSTASRMCNAARKLFKK